jgi:hypothetical protein
MLRNYNNYQQSPFRQHAYNQAAIADHYNDFANQQRHHSNAGVNHRGYDVNKSTHDTGRMAAYESGNTMQQAMRSMETAFNNEATQVQDRKMDLADNEQGRKNLQTEYDRATQMEKIRAAERMNNRNNQGLEGLMDGMNTAFSGVSPENMQVPNYDLYSNNGNRMGGSYFGRALLG